MCGFHIQQQFPNVFKILHNVFDHNTQVKVDLIPELCPLINCKMTSFEVLYYLNQLKAISENC